MKFKQLTRDAMVFKSGRKPSIEAIRESVASNDNNFRPAKYGGKKRVAIYRAGTKVEAVEIEEELTDEEIITELKKEVLKGTFDHQIRDVYREQMVQRKKNRENKAKFYKVG